MQFTELCELNNVISMMRLAACNSPRFHDRQDSEVDRIFNSSPKSELRSRDSWIDKMSFNLDTKPLQPPLIKKIPDITLRNESRIGKDNSGYADDSGTIDTKQHESQDTNGIRGSTRMKKDMRNLPPKNDAKVADVKLKTENTSPSQSTNETETIVFVKEEVPTTVTETTSMLDKLIQGTSTIGQKPPMMIGGEGGAVLHLTIYLPTRSEMAVELYDVSSVEESIQEILRKHEAENIQPPLYYGHPECYELRLHDTDGYPDDDFPALDRSRKIKNFGDAGGHEYCLCERPDACPPTGERQDTVAASKQLNTKQESIRGLKNTEKAIIKIFMPKSDDYTVVAVDNNTTGQDLLPLLNKKHRLQLFQDQYILKISEAERERLDLASDEIDMNTRLRPLGIKEATLATKQYADAPQLPTRGRDPDINGYQVGNINDSRSRPPPSTFMFNDVTVAMFKEWHVIKKNKYGKKQHRMLGMDLHKIYNRKVGERVIKSRNTTKIAERPITSVQWVLFMQDPSDFQIYFKDSLEDIVTDYTAESPYACAEIVARLKYVLSRRK